VSGYLEIDEKMTSQERRQQAYREKYKQRKPEWDDSIMLLARLFREQGVQDAVVLDAGCGRSNYVLASNRQRVKKIVGVDATTAAAAGNVLIDELVVADLERLPFADGSFDAVISLWVFEHVRLPDVVFSEIRRVLKPGGKLFFVTPYAFSYMLLAKRLVGTHLTKIMLEKWFGRGVEDTFRTYYVANTPKTLRRLFAAARMQEVFLQKNPDPSYLAQNASLFRIALFFEWLCTFFKLPFATMHLVGVFEKTA
jgi:SAM-dependent methyltransferase